MIPVSLAIHLRSNTLTQAIMFTYRNTRTAAWEDSDEDSSEEKVAVSKTKSVRKQKVKTSQPKKQSAPKSKRKRTFIQNSHSHLFNKVEIYTTCM